MKANQMAALQSYIPGSLVTACQLALLPYALLPVSLLLLYCCDCCQMSNWLVSLSCPFIRLLIVVPDATQNKLSLSPQTYTKIYAHVVASLYNANFTNTSVTIMVVLQWIDFICLGISWNCLGRASSHVLYLLLCFVKYMQFFLCPPTTTSV